MKTTFGEICISQDRPSVLFRPTLKRNYVSCPDGDAWGHAREWEAVYGQKTDDYYSGVRAYGATPEEAMIAFDLAFKTGRETTYLYDVKKNDQEVATPAG